MRVQNLSLLAIAVVAGLSLTACDGNGGNDASGAVKDSPSPVRTSTAQGSNSQASGSQASGSRAPDSEGSASQASGGGACQTSQLAFSTSPGMGEGTLIVNLENTGSAVCTLKGFPGADLQSKDGTVSAARSALTPPSVGVKPGEETRFTLHYPPNSSGGTGVTFTSLVVTPPDETHSHTLPVRINVPVTDGSGQQITVDPVGTGK
ncbi:DUF4232 domain-containing protein [Streptomyces brasiliensis]|uniref:DUF4232 domain-containing protein n=1 Tax=Streptomyces brasiliensis TaxID=1954 RepID=A0A917KVD1_9ACTN|nr:DUF4232 domain-containing protein [Streptomyces brasiliensis]GGJ31303.1 hypothetical protein GCM10010121_048240 [Streptomyces brasiliensis]